MASIPLPALALRPPPQQPGPLSQYGELLNLQNARQEQQLRAAQVQGAQLGVQQQQMDLQARQALNQAYSQAITKNADGTVSFDQQKLEAGLANGPAAYQTPAVMKGITDYQKSLVDMHNSMTDLQMKQTDMLGSAASAIKSANYDPVLAHSLLDQLPATAQTQAIRAQIDNPAGLKQLVDSAIQNSPKQRELAATEQEAQAKVSEAKTGEERLAAELPGGQLNPVSVAVQEATNPQIQQSKVALAQAEGAARAAAYGNIREYPVYDNVTKQTVFMTPEELNGAKSAAPGRYTAPSFSPGAIGQRGTTEYFTSGGGGAQLTAFNTALQHLNLLDKLGADLNNTDLQIVNRAKQAWAEQTGSAAPANFAAAKNAMSGEVAQALKKSGATDQEIAAVGETFSRAQSPAQIKGAIATYRTLLQSKAQQLQRQYQAGMQGQPAFGNQGGQPASNVDPFAQFGGTAHQ